jgi:hypothetical protein
MWFESSSPVLSWVNLAAQRLPDEFRRFRTLAQTACSDINPVMSNLRMQNYEKTQAFIPLAPSHVLFG